MTVQLQGTGFSWWWLLLLRSTGSRTFGLQSLQLPGSRAQAQSLWHMDLDAPQHVGYFWTRDRTHVSCIGRRILYHCNSKEARGSTSQPGQGGALLSTKGRVPSLAPASLLSRAHVGQHVSQPGVSSSRLPRAGSWPACPRMGKASSVGWPRGSPAGHSTGSGACRTTARNGRSSSP